MYYMSGSAQSRWVGIIGEIWANETWMDSHAMWQSVIVSAKVGQDVFL